MNYALFVVMGIALFQLFTGTVSTVSVFPPGNPDLPFVNPSVSGTESFDRRMVLSGLADTPDCVWCYYPVRHQAAIGTTGNGTVRVATKNGSFALRLTGIGHSDRMQDVLPGTNLVNGNHISILHPGYTEWYISDENGIEQGISIRSRPEGTGHLRVSYTLFTDLRPVMDGQTLFFFDDHGPVISYGGLTAYDAEGRVLPSEMRFVNNHVFLEVDDRNSVYPIIIDPWITTQTATLNATDKREQAFFGNSVSHYEDTVIVGAKGHNSYYGQAYIFRNTGGTWSETAILNASDGAAYASFGTSVSLYEDTALIGADLAKTYSGQAYVFKNNGGTWSEIAILSASDKAAYAGFGTSVSLYGDTALVGAKEAKPGGSSAMGQAYIFKDTGGTWSETAVLNASDRAAGAGFGTSVSLYNDTALIGASGAASGGYLNAGQAYVFKKSGDSWSEVAILNASDKANNANFGKSVSLYGDTALIGASGAKTSAGQVYVFKNVGGAWNETAILSASDSENYAGFGTSISLYNSTALIGASGATTEGISTAGKAYFFENSGDSWNEVVILNASDKATGAYFGASVSQYGDNAVIGAFGASPEGKTSAGQAYVVAIVEYPRPVVSGLSPQYGPLAGGTAVTITGTGFSGATAVLFGNTSGTITGTPNSTSLSVIAPSGTGTVDVTVITPGGTSATGISDRFTYNEAPTVTGITPSTGSTSTTSVVTITGTHFFTDPVPVVKLVRTGYDNVLLTGVNGTSASLRGTVPEGVNPGTWNVTVVNPDGQESGNLTTFTVTPGATPTPTPVRRGGSSGSGKQASSGRLSPGALAGQVMIFAIDEPVTCDTPAGIITVTVTPAVDLGRTQINVADAGIIDTSQLTGRQTASIVSIEPVGVNPSAIKEGSITFAVSGDWLLQHDVRPEDIVLMRKHAGEWAELPTRFDHKVGDTSYFTAQTPGFSYFAVTTRANAVTTTTVPVQTMPVTSADITPPPKSEPVLSEPAVATTTPVAVIQAPETVEGVSHGLPFFMVAVSAGGIAVVGGGMILVRRWWIRRKNPVLFRKYD